MKMENGERSVRQHVLDGGSLDHLLARPPSSRVCADCFHPHQPRRSDAPPSTKWRAETITRYRYLALVARREMATNDFTRTAHDRFS